MESEIMLSSGKIVITRRSLSSFKYYLLILFIIAIIIFLMFKDVDTVNNINMFDPNSLRLK